MKKKVLYLSYTGLLQPLGRSQILAYLKGLSDEYDINVLSFEKDISDSESIDKLNKECNKSQISWTYLKYHKKPRALATFLDMIYMAKFIVNNSNSGETILHCRSYITSIVAFFLSYFINFKFIFDMRALWVDELVSSDRLKYNGLMYRILKFLEKRILRRANHVVSLTSAAVEHLLNEEKSLNREKFTVITTCVDLERFKPADNKEKSKKIGVMGTITSGWFRQDILFKFLAAVKAIDPSIEVSLVSRDCPLKIAGFANAYGLSDYSLKSATPDDVAEAISEFTVAAMFFAPEIGKLGSAPTRLGELLACGIPVVSNSGVGDMAELITKYDVGLLLESEDDIGIVHLAEKTIKTFFENSSFSTNCQFAAVDYFSLAHGVTSYRNIYKNL